MGVCSPVVEASEAPRLTPSPTPAPTESTVMKTIPAAVPESTSSKTAQIVEPAPAVELPADNSPVRPILRLVLHFGKLHNAAVVLR